MSESAPDRTVTGLTRRRAVAAGLVRRQRPETTAASPATTPPAAAQAEPDVPAAEQSAPDPAPKRSRAPRTGRKPGEKAGKGQVNVDIATEVRDQARAAFRAAAYFEGVPTFAQFVENAIRRENERMQREHNDGQPFEPMTENLPAGRPLGGQR